MRLDAVRAVAKKRKLDLVLVQEMANVRALTGVACDHAVVAVSARHIIFYTDFRYVPMVHRVAPGLKVGDIRKLVLKGRRIGFESAVSYARYLEIRKLAPRATFVDILPELHRLRAIKTEDELLRLRAAEKLNCEIWRLASRQFRAGMSEKDMARIIQKLMIDRGDGEAFETIVCVGRNAAECHHVPDETVWDGREPVLVDMGVKLDGVCSDLTRNLCVRRGKVVDGGQMPGLYGRVYRLVREAHDAAIAAARPGLTAKALDTVAREVIRKGGFGRCFGHSLGHGVGYEIHEGPTVSPRNDQELKPGMVVTIEPGIYLEGNLGVRIEDLILITDTGCEVLSR